jgi:hypothetical protein
VAFSMSVVISVGTIFLENNGIVELKRVKLKDRIKGKNDKIKQRGVSMWIVLQALCVFNRRVLLFYFLKTFIVVRRGEIRKKK